MQKKKNFNRPYAICNNMSPKQIIDLKAKLETIHVLEKNIREHLCDLGLGQDF